MARKRTSDNPKLAGKNAASKDTKRVYLSQTDVPGYSLEQALEVPRAIAENFAY
jgi:hypothetical protein